MLVSSLHIENKYANYEKCIAINFINTHFIVLTSTLKKKKRKKVHNITIKGKGDK